MPAEKKKKKRKTRTVASAKDQDRLYRKCHTYLINNFNKFTETNKIKVALEIVKKGIPDLHEHSGGLKVEGNIEIGKAFEKHIGDLLQQFSK